MRESPALVIVPELLKAGIHVRVYDPEGMTTGRQELGDGPYYVSDPDDALRDADCVAIVTEWKQFRNLSPDRIKELMRAPVMVDMRNLFDPADMRAAGFTYYGIGRGYEGQPPKFTQAAE